MQRKEQEELVKAVRKDVNELTRVDPFQKLRFEGEWFELRTAWESLSWWRKKGTLGMNKKLLQIMRGRVLTVRYVRGEG